MLSCSFSRVGSSQRSAFYAKKILCREKCNDPLNLLYDHRHRHFYCPSLFECLRRVDTSPLRDVVVSCGFNVGGETTDNDVT